MAKKTSNPADAFRKAQRAKEVRRNKDTRKKVRETQTVKRDTRELESELAILKGKKDPASTARTAELEKEIGYITKAKEKYVKEHPEARDRVFGRGGQGRRGGQGARVDGDGEGNGDGGGAAGAGAPGGGAGPRDGRLYDELGRLRDPTRSAYFDPVYNPWGAPPPGMPYREREGLRPAGSDDESDDSDEDDDEDEDEDDSDDDIVMPDGPRPDSDDDDQDSDDSDDIPLPEGPPPPRGPPPNAPTGPRGMGMGMGPGPGPGMGYPPGHGPPGLSGFGGPGAPFQGMPPMPPNMPFPPQPFGAGGPVPGPEPGAFGHPGMPPLGYGPGPGPGQGPGYGQFRPPPPDMGWGAHYADGTAEAGPSFAPRPPFRPPQRGHGHGHGPGHGPARGGRGGAHASRTLQAVQDPLSDAPTQTYQGHRMAKAAGLPARPDTSAPPGADPGDGSGAGSGAGAGAGEISAAPVPAGPSTPLALTPGAGEITAAPQLRDLRKEATAFVPRNLKKRGGGGGAGGGFGAGAATSGHGAGDAGVGRINAAPGAGVVDEEGDERVVRRHEAGLMSRLKGVLGPLDGAARAQGGGGVGGAAVSGVGAGAGAGAGTGAGAGAGTAGQEGDEEYKAFLAGLGEL